MDDKQFPRYCIIFKRGFLEKKTEISTQCPCYLANADARLHHSQFTLPLLHTQAIIIIPCYYLCKMNFRDNCPEEFSHNGNVFQFRYYDFTKAGVLIQWLVKRVQISRKWIHEVTETGLEPRTTSFLNEHSTIWPNWPNDGAVFWVLICTMHLTVCSCHVTYAFQSESTLCSCLNVKELLARSRCEIWRLSDCNWTRIQNHLVCIRTLNQLAKWLSVRFRTVGLKGWLNPFQKLEMPLMLVCLFGLIFLGEKIPKHNEKKSKCTKFTIKIVK